MTFTYTPSFIESGLTYAAYKQHVKVTLAEPPVDDEAAKLRTRMQENKAFMDICDQTYVVSDSLRKTIEDAPDSIWLVIAEGWCTDAAFSVPMMAAIERALPGKIQLRIFLRDANLELIDANLTDGGRSIPKLIVLDKDLQEMASWGPRPARLISQVTAWKAEGLTMKQIIPKMHAWYDADATRSLQEELELLLAGVLV
jgi:hypothetical protein